MLNDCFHLHLPAVDFDISLGSDLVVSTTLLEAPGCKRSSSSSTLTAAKPPLKKDTTDPSATVFPVGDSAGHVPTSSGTNVDRRAIDEATAGDDENGRRIYCPTLGDEVHAKVDGIISCHAKELARAGAKIEYLNFIVSNIADGGKLTMGRFVINSAAAC